MDLQTARENAKVNGHTPGIVFKNSISFCKCCNAPLTFRGSNHQNYNDKPEYGIFGLYNSQCTGE